MFKPLTLPNPKELNVISPQGLGVALPAAKPLLVPPVTPPWRAMLAHHITFHHGMGMP